MNNFEPPTRDFADTTYTNENQSFKEILDKIFGEK